MKAAIFREQGIPIVIEEVDLDAPGPQELIVRTAAAGVCHSDLSVIDGHVTSLYPLPMVLGHESAGIVEAVGSLVTYVEPGDHVITCLSIFCGQCGFCLSGRPNLCPHEGQLRPAGAPPRLSQDGLGLYQMSQIGSFAEQLLVHEHAVVKIDAAFPLHLGPVLGCGVTTGLGAVFHTAKVQPGETVAIIGCGGVGLGVIQGARLAGAQRVIAIDRLAPRLHRATELGATDVIDPGVIDVREAIMEITGDGVDHAFEAVGKKETCELTLKLLRRGGTSTLLGVIPKTVLEIPGADLMYDRKLQWSAMGSNRFRIDVPRYVDLYLQGRLKLDEIVTAQRPLDEVNEAFEAMARGEGARTVLTFA